MRVTVRLFARARELHGTASDRLELPAGSDVRDCFDHLLDGSPGLAPLRERLAVAVNEEYATWDRSLSEGDTVAFIPPVSGG